MPIPEKAKQTIKHFVKAFETSRYLFLWQTKSHVLSVDKASVDVHEMQILRERFRFLLGNNYVSCSY